MTGEDMDPREAEIGRIVNEYLDRRGRGDLTSEAELLDAHPELAADLKSHFDLVREMVPALAERSGEHAASLGLPSDSLPGYQILSEIHRGGQGVVYQALQKGTRRKVAVKVMREGPFAGWRDRARFDREIQILSSLRHPHIVSIHDSGVASGNHFFVMDYVSGQPLDLWMSSGPRSMEQVLGLFIKICDAINTAHLRGIVHRDLKPGNIRISVDGEPRILDFGLAKLAGEFDAQGQTMTATGQFVGSLPWSSPEQAQGLLDQVDTRTDVYALGVVMYQLLTGRFPYEVVGAMRDVLNRIVNAEPVRPSSVRATIDGEVETILLKCLAKEPARRYQTAGELGRDLERYLQGEPITAKSDSGWYVLGKTLRRHRTVVGAALSFVLLLAVSFVASTVLWRDAANARDRALAAEHSERLERSRADGQAIEARQAREIAERRAEELNLAAYSHRIARAKTACDEGFFSWAMGLLDECPEELRGWEWHYLRRRATYDPLIEMRAHAKSASDLAVSPDGELVATSGADNRVRLWRTENGRMVCELTAWSAGSICFSPGGRLLAVGSGDSVQWWDWATASERGRQRLALNREAGERAMIRCLAFCSDTAVVVGTSAGALEVIDLSLGGLRRVDAHLGTVSCLALDRKRQILVTGESRLVADGPSSAKLWDLSTMAELQVFTGLPSGVDAVGISPDGRRVAVGCSIPGNRGTADGTLKVFDRLTGEELLSLRGHEGAVNDLAFSPDGRMLASVGNPRGAPAHPADNTLKLWNSTTGDQLYSLPAHGRSAAGVAWTPDGQRVISIGEDGYLRIWPNKANSESRHLRDSFESTRQIAFSPDGRRLIGCELTTPTDRMEDRFNRLRVWDVATGEVIKTIDAHPRSILAVDWSPDGRLVASSGHEDAVRFWDTTSWAERGSIRLGQTATHLCFGPDGQLLGMCNSHDAWVYRTSEQVELLHLADIECRDITFSFDGRLLGVARLNGTVEIFKLPGFEESRVIHIDSLLARAHFAMDGMLLCADLGGSLSMWNPVTGERVLASERPTKSIASWIGCSPDGKRVATGANDLLLRIWDATTLTELFAVRAHDSLIMCAEFSPDGRRIATCGNNNEIKIWDTGSEEGSPIATQPTRLAGLAEQ